MDTTKTCFIDLSHNNDEFNWSEMSPAIKGVILKATQGATFKDNTMIQHSNNARAKNLYVGFYHFLNFTDTAEAQAANFLSRGIDFNRAGTLPPIVDIENQVDPSNPANNAALDKHVFNNPNDSKQLVADYLGIIEAKTGRKPIIYTYNGFWTPTLHSPDFSSYPLWVAAYQTKPPHMFGNWTNYALWQFSESGTIAGPTGGGIDWSVLNVDINTLLP